MPSYRQKPAQPGGPRHGGRSAVIRIAKSTLSGSEPAKVQEQAAALAPAPLRDLAVQLAADPDLTVSVISYGDGRHELEILHTGGPQHTEDTIDRHRFTRQPNEAAFRTLSIATRPDSRTR